MLRFFPALIILCSSAVAVAAIKSKSRNALENEYRDSNETGHTRGSAELWKRVTTEIHTTIVKDHVGKVGRVAREELREHIMNRAKKISQAPCVEDPSLASVSGCDSPEDKANEWPQGESRQGLRPPWTMHLIQQPKGKKDMGTWTAWCYTKQQQDCLGITEQGYCPGESIWPDFKDGRPDCNAKDSGETHHPPTQEHHEVQAQENHDTQAQSTKPKEEAEQSGQVPAVAERTTLTQHDKPESRRPVKRASQLGVIVNSKPVGYMDAIRMTDDHMQKFFAWYDRDGTVTIEFREALTLMQEMRDSYAIPYSLQFKLRTSLLSFDRDSDLQDDLDLEEFGKFTEAVLGGRLPAIFES